MLAKFVDNKNTVRLAQMYSALEKREEGLPGMGLVHGFSGAGKSRAVTQLIQANNGVYVRAMALWSPGQLCASIAQAIGLDQVNGSNKCLMAVLDRLSLTSRPLFVDEADYLFANLRSVETLRDIHDYCNVPVVLIGMDGIERKVLRSRQLARRMSRSVEFLPLDRDDHSKLCDAVCEVTLDDCIKTYLYDKTKGSVGLTMVAISQLERFGGGMRKITLADWETSDWELFLGACV
jgi:DNA transposition AAA+ family ATPase